MNEFEKFDAECIAEIAAQGGDKDLQSLTSSWFLQANKMKYSYHFSWMGRPIIQYPQDMVAMQEIIWKVKPDLIIETGIAHGGSLIMNASFLAMLDMVESIETGAVMDPAKPKRRVLGIDIDIRAHNKAAIEDHPMSHRINMIQGSSTDPSIVKQVCDYAKDYKNILISLDSNHTHDHVLAELEAYADLTTVGSYCVVFDTVVEDLPGGFFPDRSWGPGNSPKSAALAFLKTNSDFEIDKEIDNKIMISVAPDGYLKRVK